MTAFCSPPADRSRKIPVTFLCLALICTHYFNIILCVNIWRIERMIWTQEKSSRRCRGRNDYGSAGYTSQAAPEQSQAHAVCGAVEIKEKGSAVFLLLSGLAFLIIGGLHLRILDN